MHVGCTFVILVFLFLISCTKNEKLASISVPGSGNQITQESQTPSGTNECSSSTIKLKKSDGTLSDYNTLQLAVDNADAGSTIEVGLTSTNSLVSIKMKKDLTIFTHCLSSVKAFSIIESTGITIDGFVVESKGLLIPGIEIFSMAKEIKQILAKNSGTNDDNDKSKDNSGKGSSDNLRDDSKKNEGNKNLSNNQQSKIDKSKNESIQSEVSNNNDIKQNQTISIVENTKGKEIQPSQETKSEPKDDDKKISEDKHKNESNSENSVVSSNDDKFINETEDHDDEDTQVVKSSNIIIKNCRIQKSDLDYPGIRVHGGVGSLSIFNNYIFENGSDGIRFINSSKGGPFLIEKNIITYNVKNGIVLPKKQFITLKNNMILTNGTGVSGGYGLRITGNDGDRNPTHITLTDNIIAFNNGKIISNSEDKNGSEGKDKDHKGKGSNTIRSSQDISFFASILNSTDSGNKTTTGTEGVGVLKLEDKVAPVIHLATKDQQRTTNSHFWLEMVIEETSPVETQVFQNGAFLFSTNQFVFEKEVSLVEGMNTFLISSKDAFGNVSITSELKSIILDTTPPIISTVSPPQLATFYTNQFPFNINVQWKSNEPLSSAKIQGGTAQLNPNEIDFSKVISLSQEGNFVVPIEAFDLLNNKASGTITGSLILDNVPPVVTVTIADNFKTKDNTITVPVEVTETSPVWTAIYINEVKMFETASLKFNSPVFPLNEGENIFKIIAVDAAGNESIANITHIFRDTTPPVILTLSPANHSVISGFNFSILGTSNEVIKSAKVNGMALTIDTSGTSFNGIYTATTEGSHELTFELSDELDNILVQTVSVTNVVKSLNPALIKLIPQNNSGKILVKGGMGSVRPGLLVKGSVGLFNNQSVMADNFGAFELLFDPFTKITVSVFDPTTNSTSSEVFIYGDPSDNLLSGMIKSTTNLPLPGVQVSIAGSSLSVVTDTNGLFKFTKSSDPDKILTGNQTLIINGSQVPQTIEGANRIYSQITVSIHIGISESNVLERPIYLAPTILDGTETLVSATSGASIQNAHAPGVALNIPPQATTFPGGVSQAKISMMTIPSEFSTIPTVAGATPKDVVALEPSGTTFNQPVELTLPNSSDFVPGTEMIILLMNSKTGRWEVGGAAKVSSDGQSIVTKQGQGIRHFSLAYATISGPEVLQISSQDKPGADVFNGSSATSIELPAIKSIESSHSSSLTYKSAWAKPQVLVKNLVDLPTKKVDVTLDPIQVGVFGKYKVDLKQCTQNIVLLNLPFCSSNPKEFYTFSYFEQVFSNAKQISQVEEVSATFETANIKTETYKFTGIPEQATLSYSLPLINPETQDYLSTGVYPYNAHYEFKFKNFTLATVGVRQKSTNGTTSPFIEEPKETELIALRTVLPQDLGESIFLQNYRKSPAGSGWRMNGVQKIVNPTESKIMLEEENGGISSYNISNTIETVYKLGSSDSTLSNGVGLNQWPKVQFMDSKAQKFFEVDVSTTDKALNEKGSMYSWSGTVSGFDYFNFDTQTFSTNTFCAERLNFPGGNVCTRFETEVITTNHPHSRCASHSRNYTISSQPQQLLATSDGRIFGTDSFRHSVFEMNGLSSKMIMGRTQPTSSFQNNYATTTSNHLINMNDYCNSINGMNCAQPPSGFDLTKDGYNTCGSIVLSNGEVPLRGNVKFVNVKECRFSGFTLVCVNKLSSDQRQSMNEPMGLVAHPLKQDILVVADYGNNKIRELNTKTLETKDFAEVQSPRGLVFDREGNLYVSTKDGFIKKINLLGQVSDFAGATNGYFVNSVDARVASFLDPYGMDIDNERGFLYVADTGHHRVVRINLVTLVADQIAGNNSVGYSGDGGPALNATLNHPTHLKVDNEGNLIIADSGNQTIRRIIFQNSSFGKLVFAPTTNDGSKLVRLNSGVWERSYRNGTKVVFDSSGKQTQLMDRIGRITQTTYDLEGRLETMTNSVNQKVTYSYTGDLLESITDSAGRETSFHYNSLNQLTSVVFPDGNSKTFTYNQEGLLTGETNERQVLTSYEYNDLGRLLRVNKNNENSVTIVDSSSQLAINNKPPGKLQQSGLSPEKVKDKIIDARGMETTFDSDYNGFISKISDPKGRVTTIKRDLKGLPVEINALGSTKKMTYDPITEDLIKVEWVEAGVNETYTYDGFGNLLTKKDFKGFLYQNIYDGRGLLTRSIEPGNKVTDFVYSSSGLLVSRTTYTSGSLGITIQYEYDPLGRLVKEKLPGGVETQYVLDLAGNPIEKIQRKDAVNLLNTKYEYDSWNRLTKVTSPKNEVTSYKYLPTGELYQIIDPKNNITQFDYDNLGQLTKKADQTGAIYEFAYDKSGNKTLEKDPIGNLKTFTYNELNQLIEATLPDQSLKYEYNLKGSLTRVSSPVSDISMDFDAKNRVISVMSSGLGNLSTYPSTTLNYGYDANDNLTSMTSSLGSTNYNYDPLNRLVSLTNRLGEQFSWSYDNASRLTNESRPGTSTVYTYNAQALLESITHRTSSSIKSQLSYLYDQNNQPIQKSTTLGVFNYAYDNNGQLVSATHPTLTQEQFSYDPLGNRIADQNGNYVYDDKAQQLKEDYLFEYFYDANGNLIQKLPKDPTHKGFVYNYSSTNQLIELSITDGPTGPRILHIKYTYDALGRRMQKEVINSQEPAKSYTKKYVYNSDNVLLEYDAQNDLIAEYTHSPLRPDDILAAHISTEGVNAQLAKAEGSYFYLKDHLGSITEVTNSAGNILQKYDYASFGKLNKITDEAGNDITDSPLLATTYTYTGRELEKESGLYYYRARYYDPAIGRFLQSDPSPGHMVQPASIVNKYIYALNVPIWLRDPSGRSPWDDAKKWIEDIAIGALVVGVIVLSGGTALGALTAVGSVAGGAAAASAVMAAVQGGDFWKNFSNNFHTNFRISAAFLAAGAIYASIFSGGVAQASGNGLQGALRSNQALLDGRQSGLTIGSSAIFDSPSVASHEFGHTLQFIGISALTRSPQEAWNAYLGLGAIGTIPIVGSAWESSATWVGGL